MMHSQLVTLKEVIDFIKMLIFILDQNFPILVRQQLRKHYFHCTPFVFMRNSLFFGFQIKY